jgi:hypothetical protein
MVCVIIGWWAGGERKLSVPNKHYPKVHPEAISGDMVCGQCQWFVSGFKGQNCKTVREVVVDTPACVEFVPHVSDFYEEISLADKYIIGIRQAMLSNKFKLDESTLIDELKSYMVEMDLRHKPYGTQQDLEAISQAIRQIIAYRSRVSSIYTSVLDLKHELEELMRHASLWLYSKYSNLQELKNESYRKAAFDRILPESIQLSTTLEKLSAVARYVDEKLDGNERALGKIISSAEKLWFSKEKFPTSKSIV